MFQRLRRSAIGFGMVLAAFTVYRVAAVPFLEPAVPTATRSADYAMRGPASGGDSSLKRIFPPGSWQLNDPFKFENGHSQLLMGEYENQGDGRVKMKPCSIVFFQGDPEAADGDASQGRVIVLDAPEAIAQFDQPLDLKNAKIGRLLGAQFLGPVTIRGTPSRPGSNDDIAAATRNVQMNTEWIWTPEPVDFRVGQSTGHGRDLRIHLLPSGHSDEHSPGIGGIQAVELLHDVQMRLVSNGPGMMPMDARHRDEKPANGSTGAATSADDKSPADRSPTAVAPRMPPAPPRPGLPAPVADYAAIERQGTALGGDPAAPKTGGQSITARKAAVEPNPPVDIRCQGKFRFDMTQYVASFEDQVEVLRTPHDGPNDQMNCEQLFVHFAPREPVKTGTAAAAQNSSAEHAGAASSAAGSNGATKAAAPAHAATAPAANESGSSTQKMPALEPRWMEARGNPVIVRAPSNGSYARGEHLVYDIAAHRITLDGGDEVWMQQRLNEIHGRKIVYEPGENGQLGLLSATGAGWLRGVPPQPAPKKQTPGSPADNPRQTSMVHPFDASQPPAGMQPTAGTEPPQLFEAHWSRELKMRPFDGEHLISLVGDARAGFSGQGELSADEIWLWVFEAAPTDRSQPAGGSTPKSQVQPDRMQAVGNVQINSPQLVGSCRRLQAWFQQAPAAEAQKPAGPRIFTVGAAPNGSPFAPQAAIVAASSAGGGVGMAIPSAAVAFAPSVSQSSPSQNIVAQNALQNNPPPSAPADNGFLPSFGRSPHGAQTGPASRYEVNGELIRLQLVTQDSATKVENLNVDGQVHLVEIQTPTPGDEPLQINGDSLQIVRASEPDTGVTISGRPGQAASRGMEMYGDVIRLDKGTNRLWIDGPGRMKLPANQLVDDNDPLGGPISSGPRPGPIGVGAPGSPRLRPGGAPQPPPQPIYIDWQGRMAFDGMLARFERSVVCQTDTRNLRTELLDVTMRERVDFSQKQNGQRSEVGKIFCHGDVLMESRGFDLQHVLTNFERMMAHDLTVDKVTGLIDGQGPGWLTSVRRGQQAGAASPGAGRGSARSPAAEPVIRPTSQTGVLPATAFSQQPGQPQQPGQRPAGRGQHAAANPNQLSYLNVQFQGPISGNLNHHEITFHDQVRAISGPVLDWSDQLNLDKVESLEENQELLNCDQMTLRQGPLVQQPGQPPRRPMEMEATGNVSVEGATFRALAYRLTYAEAKDLLVLDGDGRNDAQLFRQDRIGAPPGQIAAQQILYWKTADQVSVNGAHSFNLDQGTAAAAPPSATPPKPVAGQTPAGKKPPPGAGLPGR